MAHALQAYITRDADVGALMAEKGRIFHLAQDYILLPLTDALLIELGIPMLAFDEDDRPAHFMSIDSLGREFSVGGTVAYIEAVDLNAMSYQGAAGYRNGAVVVSHSKKPGMLEAALRALGGESWTTGDLFDALGLGKHAPVELRTGEAAS